MSRVRMPPDARLDLPRIPGVADRDGVEEHDLTTDDVDHVLENYVTKSVSRRSGRPCVFGYAPDGWYIVVIYEEDEDAVIPVTAYEVDGP